MQAKVPATTATQAIRPSRATPSRCFPVTEDAEHAKAPNRAGQLPGDATRLGHSFGAVRVHDKVRPVTEMPSVVQLMKSTVGADSARRRVATGEEVTLEREEDAGAGDWSLENQIGALTVEESGQRAKWDVAVPYEVDTTKETVRAGSEQLEFTVVTPTDAEMSVHTQQVMDDSNGPGSWMVLTYKLMPDDVSFAGVQIKEADQDAKKVEGYFAEHLTEAQQAHEAGKEWVGITGGNMADGQDNARTGEATFKDYKQGVLEWSIPLCYRKAGTDDDGKQFTTIEQTMTYDGDADYSATVEKADKSSTRTAKRTEELATGGGFSITLTRD